MENSQVLTENPVSEYDLLKKQVEEITTIRKILQFFLVVTVAGAFALLIFFPELIG